MQFDVYVELLRYVMVAILEVSVTVVAVEYIEDSVMSSTTADSDRSRSKCLPVKAPGVVSEDILAIDV